ncbi:MAG: 23S rRNA (guanosine(2251)-2'-O)-methyltransferase RlmB, partial [Bacteroidetes bacterium]|nr:23S rRNA (guanosine(2251)-2'-O)-methyltransferase RlmB [Bacteroidota bacterium]
MEKENKDISLIFGIRPVQEAIDAGNSFVKVYVQKGTGESIRNIKQMLNRAKIIFTEVPKEKLDSLSKFKN